MPSFVCRMYYHERKKSNSPISLKMLLLLLTKLLGQCLSEVLDVVTELLRQMLVGLNHNAGNPLVQSQLNVK